MSYWIWFQIPNSQGISFQYITQWHFPSSLRCDVLFNPNFFSDVCHFSNTFCSTSLLAFNEFHSFKLMHQSTRNLSSVNLNKHSAYYKKIAELQSHKCNHVDKDPLHLFFTFLLEIHTVLWTLFPKFPQAEKEKVDGHPFTGKYR